MPTPDHGTRGRYRAGCHCDKCKAWKADDTAKYRAAKRGGIPAAETARATPKRARPTRAKEGAPSRADSATPPTRIAGPIERELTEALEQLGDTTSPWTKTLRATALGYAKAIDEATPEVVARLMPQLLGNLERLGLDPEPPKRPAAAPPPAGGTNPEGQVADDDDPAAGIRRVG